MPLSNKEKMLAGELYFANDPELVADRRAAQRCLAQYNGTDADDQPGRMALLRQLFGAVGDNPDILPRFHCDYGYNIRVGRNCFINYNCVFLDCAPIEIGDDLQMAPAVQLYAGTGRPASSRHWNTQSRSASATACGSAAAQSCCRE